MTPIIILGSGGHALACLDVIDSTKKFKILGYVDAGEAQSWEGLTRLGSDNDLPSLMKDCSNFFMGIGQIKNASVRKNLSEKIKQLKGEFPFIVSPFANVSPRAQVHEGTIIMHHAHVGPGSQIGSFNILNTKSLIEHGVKTGSFVHVSTAAVVNGDVIIGGDAFIGSNSVLCHGIEIPSGAFVQAGAFIGRKHVW